MSDQKKPSALAQNIIDALSNVRGEGGDAAAQMRAIDAEIAPLVEALEAVLDDERGYTSEPREDMGSYTSAETMGLVHKALSRVKGD